MQIRGTGCAIIHLRIIKQKKAFIFAFTVTFLNILNKIPGLVPYNIKIPIMTIDLMGTAVPNCLYKILYRYC